MSDKPNETCSSPEKSVPYGLEAAGHGPTVKPSGSLVFTLPHAPFNSLALANSVECKSASLRSAPVRLAPLRLALFRWAPLRLVNSYRDATGMTLMTEAAANDRSPVAKPVSRW
jgi:hypothetical protein